MCVCGGGTLNRKDSLIVRSSRKRLDQDILMDQRGLLGLRHGLLLWLGSQDRPHQGDVIPASSSTTPRSQL